MSRTRKVRHTTKRRGGKKSKTTKKVKKGGNMSLVMSQLAAPLVLMSANQMYGKRVAARRSANMSRSRRSHRRR